MTPVPWPARRDRAGDSASRDSGNGAGHLVICGDDPLALRLVEELALRYRRSVTVILADRKRNWAPQICRVPGVKVVVAERLDADAFRAARLTQAQAMAIVYQDDVGNLHAALQAQEINPELRLVLRMFNMSLGHGIRKLVRHCRVLSDAAIAAPSFVASALGEVAPTYVRLAGRTLYVARRAEVPADELVCGLADTTSEHAPVLLPADQERCDLVLAVATGTPRLAGLDSPGDPSRPGRVARWRRWSMGRLFGPRVSASLRIALIALVVLLVAGTGLLAWLDPNLSVGQAAYATVLLVISGANPDLTISGWEQAIQTALALVGIALFPVVTAAVVEAVVNARLALALGRMRGPVRDHVVVVGLGNVGTRVIQQLRTLGVPVVAVDRTDQARGAQLARDLDVPLIIGDASREETLREASIRTARALLALSTDDVVNLEAGLHARTLNTDIRVSLRLFDGDLADRVERTFGITSSKSVSFLAVPAFATAMLEREVIGTIPIKRRGVLLIADVPVEPGSMLDGAPVGEVVMSGHLRVLAVDGSWQPDPLTPLAAGQGLLVVATKTGLTRLLTQAAPAAADPVGNPDPLAEPV